MPYIESTHTHSLSHSLTQSYTRRHAPYSTAGSSNKNNNIILQRAPRRHTENVTYPIHDKQQQQQYPYT